MCGELLVLGNALDNLHTDKPVLFSFKKTYRGHAGFAGSKLPASSLSLSFFLSQGYALYAEGDEEEKGRDGAAYTRELHVSFFSPSTKEMSPMEKRSDTCHAT